MAPSDQSAIALDISTDAERRPIKINGQVYHLNDVDDLTMADQIRLGNVGKRYQHLQDSLDSLSDDEIDDLQAKLTWAARIALHDVPDELFEALKDGHKLAIVEAFSMGLQEGDPAVQSQNESPDSSGSTEYLLTT